MKKSLLLAGMLAVGLANAQTGKVGINTENPNETLEVNGTLRVDNLPESGVGNIYDGADTAGTIFTATDMVVSDAKGNVGKVAYPFPQVIRQTDGLDTVPTAVNIDIPDAPTIPLTSGDSRRADADLYEYTFTLDKKSLVVINTNLAYSLNSKNINGNLKRVANLYYINGKEVLASANYLFKGDTTETDEYLLQYPETPSTYQLHVAGPYSLVGNITQVLEPGEYTFKVVARVIVPPLDLKGIRVRFGSYSRDMVSIVAHPLEF